MGKERTSRPIARKIRTQIWCDIPESAADEFHSGRSLCYGYDFYRDIPGRYSWTEALFLLLKGRLPSAGEASLLDSVLCSLINPGPRDWATQAAMTAAVSGATVGNCLMTGLAVLQGRYHGSLSVEGCMAMLREGTGLLENGASLRKAVTAVIGGHPGLPGYGLHYTGRDMRAARLMELAEREGPCGRSVELARAVEKRISRTSRVWLTLAGASSAVLLDLGFTPQEGHGIFLLSAGPGLLAHLLEQRAGNWNSYPFPSPPEYQGPRKRKLTRRRRAYGKEPHA